MNLSEHFTLAEATASQTADRYFIDNTPPPVYIEKLKVVAKNILEPVRVEFDIPFKPSSWYRCQELCIKIGSKSTSQHALAEAVDFEVPGIDNLTLAYWMQDNVDFDKLILEFYSDGDPHSGWVHASYRSKHDNRHEVYTITRDNGTVVTKRGLPS